MTVTGMSLSIGRELFVPRPSGYLRMAGTQAVSRMDDLARRLGDAAVTTVEVRAGPADTRHRTGGHASLTGHRHEGSHSSAFQCAGVIESPLRIGHSHRKFATTSPV